jgi:hypothetical protein
MGKRLRLLIIPLILAAVVMPVWEQGLIEVLGVKMDSDVSYLPISALAVEGAVVEVDTVEDLYAAINNPNNAGATIKLLAVGSPYVLTPIDPNGQTRPNGGSLFLQPGMALVGENVYNYNSDGDEVPDPRDDNGDGVPDMDEKGREIYAEPLSETIIDGTLLNVIGPGNIVPGAIVVVGPVEVSISNVTVRGGPRAQAEIEVRAPGDRASNVTISECILESARRGIIVDGGDRWLSDNGTVNLLAERNVIRDHIVPRVVQGWGIHSQQGNGSGIRFYLDIRHNRFHHNKLGLLLGSLGMQDGETTVVSQSNFYEEAVLTSSPTLVHILSGGIVAHLRDMGSRGSYRNLMHLMSTDDAIWNNEGWSGLYVQGLNRRTSDTEFMDNEIYIELLRTLFVKVNEDGTFDGLQNREARIDPGQTEKKQPMLRSDITIVGADNSGANLRESPEVFTGPASNNKVWVKVKEATSSLMRTDYDRKPEPFVIIDNAPDQVEVELELEEINFIGS